MLAIEMINFGGFLVTIYILIGLILKYVQKMSRKCPENGVASEASILVSEASKLSAGA